MNKRFSLLGFGLVGLFGLNKKFKLSYFINIFVVSAVLAIAYVVLMGAGFSDFFKGEAGGINFTIFRIEYVNHHMIFNFFLNISFIGVWYILSRRWKLIHWTVRILYLLSTLLIVYTLAISEGQEKYDIYRTEYQTDEFRDYIDFHQTKLNDCHNQYLQTTMEFGIFGLLILLFIYTFPLFVINKQRRILSIIFMFLCMYQSVFDMFLTGQFSGLFGILLICLFSVENDVIRNNQMIED